MSLPLSFLFLFFSLLASWCYQEDGIPDIMCHVKSSYAFRTVKLLFILQARARRARERKSGVKKGGLEGSEKREKGRESEKQARLGDRRNHLATSNPLRAKLRSYHRASCQDARARVIYKCKRMRECFWFNDAALFSGRGGVNFVIVGTEDSNATKVAALLEIRRVGCFQC